MMRMGLGYAAIFLAFMLFLLWTVGGLRGMEYLLLWR